MRLMKQDKQRGKSWQRSYHAIHLIATGRQEFPGYIRLSTRAEPEHHCKHSSCTSTLTFDIDVLHCTARHIFAYFAIECHASHKRDAGGVA